MPLITECRFGEENGYHGMMNLLDTQEVEAVFVSHDPSAIGALRAALDRGLRVPEDIALVGFADMECAGHVAVPLTTVSQPKVELGETLAASRCACCPARQTPPPGLCSRRGLWCAAPAALSTEPCRLHVYYHH